MKECNDKWWFHHDKWWFHPQWSKNWEIQQKIWLVKWCFCLRYFQLVVQKNYCGSLYQLGQVFVYPQHSVSSYYTWFFVCLWLQEFIILTGLDFTFHILVKWSELEQQLSGISFEKKCPKWPYPMCFLSEFIVFRGAFYQNSIEFKVHLACFALVHGYPTRWSAGRDGWNPTSARAGLGICRCPGAWKTCKLGEILIGAMMVSPCFTNKLGFQQEFEALPGFSWCHSA